MLKRGKKSTKALASDHQLLTAPTKRPSTIAAPRTITPASRAIVAQVRRPSQHYLGTGQSSRNSLGKAQQSGLRSSLVGSEQKSSSLRNSPLLPSQGSVFERARRARERSRTLLPAPLTWFSSGHKRPSPTLSITLHKREPSRPWWLTGWGYSPFQVICAICQAIRAALRPPQTPDLYLVF